MAWGPPLRGSLSSECSVSPWRRERGMQRQRGQRGGRGRGSLKGRARPFDLCTDPCNSALVPSRRCINASSKVSVGARGSAGLREAVRTPATEPCHRRQRRRFQSVQGECHGESYKVSPKARVTARVPACEAIGALGRANQSQKPTRRQSLRTPLG